MDNNVMAEEQATSLLENKKVDAFSETNLFKHEKATKAKKIKKWKQNLQGWGFSLWPLYTYIVFAMVPFVLSIYLSMTDLHKWDINFAKWVGFDNYVWLLTSSASKFFWSLGRTLYYCLSLPIGIFLGLFSSVMLTGRIKCRKLFRTILYIPNVCSSVGVTMMWQLIFDPNESGLINNILMSLGAVDQPMNFFENGQLFMPLVIFTTTWNAGSGSILFQAALEQINGSLVEAAKVDGANSFQVFFNITMPAISPTTFYVLVTNLIGCLQAMGAIQLFANNGYGPDTDGQGNYAGLTTVYYMYLMAFVNTTAHGMGKASACAWILAILIVAVTRLNFKLSDYWVCYDN